MTSYPWDDDDPFSAAAADLDIVDAELVTDDRSLYVEAVCAAAFPIKDGRTVIHSRSGGMGADWDVTDVLHAVRTGTAVGWCRSFMGHELRVVTADGQVVQFEVDAPRRPDGTMLPLPGDDPEAHPAAEMPDVTDLALPEQIGVDVRLAVVDWTDPTQAAASASQARAAILRQVRELYQDKRDDRKPGKTATSGVTTSAQVAPELGFLAAASYALDAFADAVKAGSDEARGIAGDVVLEVQPEREVGTATVRVGTVNGTVKATRTQATKPSVDTERIVDILVADLISNLPEKSGSGETAAYAAGARAAIAGLLGVISPPSFKTTALDDWQRRLEANGEDDLAIRLAHAYGRVPTGDAKTKLTIEPAKAATL